MSYCFILADIAEICWFLTICIGLSSNSNAGNDIILEGSVLIMTRWYVPIRWTMLASFNLQSLSSKWNLWCARTDFAMHLKKISITYSRSVGIRICRKDASNSCIKPMPFSNGSLTKTIEWSQTPYIAIALTLETIYLSIFLGQKVNNIIYIPLAKVYNIYLGATAPSHIQCDSVNPLEEIFFPRKYTFKPNGITSYFLTSTIFYIRDIMKWTMLKQGAEE